MRLSVEEVDMILDHCRHEVPHEACGILLDFGSGEPRLVVACANVHPEPTRGYRVADASLAGVGTHVLAGARIAAIYHSHTNGVPGLSEEDRRCAAPAGRPLYPGSAYLVAAVDPGGDWGLRAYTWERGEYRRVALTVSELTPKKLTVVRKGPLG